MALSFPLHVAALEKTEAIADGRRVRKKFSFLNGCFQQKPKVACEMFFDFNLIFSWSILETLAQGHNSKEIWEATYVKIFLQD